MADFAILIQKRIRQILLYWLTTQSWLTKYMYEEEGVTFLALETSSAVGTCLIFSVHRFSTGSTQRAQCDENIKMPKIALMQ